MRFLVLVYVDIGPRVLLLEAYAHFSRQKSLAKIEGNSCTVNIRVFYN